MPILRVASPSGGEYVRCISFAGRSDARPTARKDPMPNASQSASSRILAVSPKRDASSSAAPARFGGVTMLGAPFTSSRAKMTPLATACAFSTAVALPGGKAPSNSKVLGPVTALSLSGVFVPRNRRSAWRPMSTPSTRGWISTPSTHARPADPPFKDLSTDAALAPASLQSVSVLLAEPKPTRATRLASLLKTCIALLVPSLASKDSSSMNSRKAPSRLLSTASPMRPRSNGPSSSSDRARMKSTRV
mmetsp:Transcript_86247/g.239147  ORF Transcript_86247/g.239147 Transcript_86247/m.239147 type:complete len:248 (+) Transcript_86247:1077-1820(+)